MADACLKHALAIYSHYLQVIYKVVYTSAAAHRTPWLRRLPGCQWLPGYFKSRPAVPFEFHTQPQRDRHTQQLEGTVTLPSADHLWLCVEVTPRELAFDPLLTSSS